MASRYPSGSPSVKPIVQAHDVRDGRSAHEEAPRIPPGRRHRPDAAEDVEPASEADRAGIGEDARVGLPFAPLGSGRGTLNLSRGGIYVVQHCPVGTR